MTSEAWQIDVEARASCPVSRWPVSFEKAHIREELRGVLFCFVLFEREAISESLEILLNKDHFMELSRGWEWLASISPLKVVGEKRVLKRGGERTRLLLLGEGACALCGGCCHGFTCCPPISRSPQIPSTSVCDLCPSTLWPMLHRGTR